MIKIIPKKKKCKKAKWLYEEALQIAMKRSEVKGKREKDRYTHLNAEFQRIARIEKASEVINANKWRKTIEWERLEISSRKLEIPRQYAKKGSIKDRKGGFMLMYGKNQYNIVK